MKKINLLQIFAIHIFIAFCVMLFLSVPAFADMNKELTFTWEQSVDDLPELQEWRLYMSSTSGGPYTAALDTQGAPIIIGYDPAQTGGLYTSTQTMVIPGNPGTSVNVYFVMTAVDKDGNETAYSEQAIDEETGNDFVVIKIPMGRPFSVKVKVKAGNVP
jgi:hypothetical protein